MNYIIRNGELYHHGVKGMKWGRRRYQNPDGSLTPAGKKRYAKAGYAKDFYESNKTVVGKAYDKFTGAHKIAAELKYDSSSKAKNDARAEKYAIEKQTISKDRQEKTKQMVTKGSEVAGKLMMADLVDDMFYGGAGKRATKAAVKTMGRAVITANEMRKGGYDIHWYDD